MGKEAECIAHVGGKRVSGKAQLETDELVFRGANRLRIPLKSITRLAADDGVLHVTYPEGSISLELGGAAAKWEHAIRNPRGLLDKLDVKEASKVVLIGIEDTAFAGDISLRASVLPSSRIASADVVFLGADDKKSLARVARIAEKLKGATALWVVAPKGVKHITEMDVLNAGRAAGLKDVKVARFSETHTAHKFVIPVSAR
jgi:hypothetical protein